MNIEEQIYEVYDEIKKIQTDIDNLQSLDYQTLDQYTDVLFKLKRKLQILEEKSFLERMPDLVSDEIDLYLKNIHDLKESNPDRYSYIITLHNTKTKIGVIDIRFSLLESEKYLGNIGSEINDEYRGNRYAKKAFILLKDVMLSHGLRKPKFTVVTSNTSSIKSLSNIGAKKVELVDNVNEQYYIYEYDLENNSNLKK